MTDRTPKPQTPPKSQRDAPVQPIPERNHAPGDPKEGGYGPIGADPKANDHKTKYDVPSREDEDFAIDEERDKRIRGNEAPKDVADPD